MVSDNSLYWELPKPVSLMVRTNLIEKPLIEATKVTESTVFTEHMT